MNDPDTRGPYTDIHVLAAVASEWYFSSLSDRPLSGRGRFVLGMSRPTQPHIFISYEVVPLRSEPLEHF